MGDRYDPKDKFLIRDSDAKFGEAVDQVITAVGLSVARTSFRSPWQNGVAERLVWSCRGDLLDHCYDVAA
jgi:putative transposase